jgi:hypothetical protein
MFPVRRFRPTIELDHSHLYVVREPGAVDGRDLRADDPES